MVFTKRGATAARCAAARCTAAATVSGGAAAAVESTDGWSDGVPRGKVGSSSAVLYSMCTSSYPIGLESLLDFLPWDF